MSNSESPIGQADKMDIIGVRKDGGIDTVIVCCGQLDSSPTTLQQLELKIRNYLREVVSDSFTQEYGSGPVRIFISGASHTSREASQLVTTLAKEASCQNIRLQLGDPVA